MGPRVLSAHHGLFQWRPSMTISPKKCGGIGHWFIDPRDPSTFSEGTGTWTLQTYISVPPITFWLLPKTPAESGRPPGAAAGPVSGAPCLGVFEAFPKEIPKAVKSHREVKLYIYSENSFEQAPVFAWGGSLFIGLPSIWAPKPAKVCRGAMDVCFHVFSDALQSAVPQTQPQLPFYQTPSLERPLVQAACAFMQTSN